MSSHKFSGWSENMFSKKSVLISSTLLILIFSTLALTLTPPLPKDQRDATLSIDISTYSFHVTTEIQRAGEDESTFWSHHAGVLTNIGADWIEDQLGDSPSTQPADYISLSTDATSPVATWTQIISEIASGGLSRAQGTYASTGTGQWTISYQWTASATHTNVQLTGLQYGSSGDNNLLAADTFTPVTLNSGDKLTVTWTITVS
jgi:hypothetical protein